MWIKFLEIIESVGEEIKKGIEKLSLSVGGYFFYAFLIYALVSLYHFFPALFGYENLTLYFLFYFVLFIIYKKVFFYDFMKSYLENLRITFSIFRLILPYLLFFGFLLFYVGGQDLSTLSGLLFVFCLTLLFNLFFPEKNDRYFVIFRKYDFTKKRFYFMVIVVNILLTLFLGKWLAVNNSSYFYSIIIPILIIYNICLYGIFTDFFSHLFVQITKNTYLSNIFTSRGGLKSFGLNNRFYFLFITFFLVGYIALQVYGGVSQNVSSKPKINVSNVKIGTGKISSRSGGLIPIKSSQQTGVIIGDLYNFKKYIGLGDTGNDVKKLQEILKTEGYFSGSLNGIFDSGTSLSLSNFFGDKVGTGYTQLGPKAMEFWKKIEVSK